MSKTLLAVLKAAGEGDRGIIFIQSSGEEYVLSYRELWRKSLMILHNLNQAGLRAGDELVMQVERNDVFLLLFWACLQGGIIPVPLALGKQDSQRRKVFNVWKKLNNPFLVGDAGSVGEMAQLQEPEDDWSINDRVLYTADMLKEEWDGEPVVVSEEDIAYIQYSSGSTGDPKGVILTHANLVANITDIALRSRITAEDRALSWLPLTHDMGIICCHLTCVLAGIDQYLIPTSLYIRRPLLWMDKASEHRVTILYSPNFGYQYLMEAMSSMAGAGVSGSLAWDLGQVRIIYNGAEPISRSICGDFLKKMEEYGLSGISMFMGYGLAEASVAVCLPEERRVPPFVLLDRGHLNVGDVCREVESEGVAFAVVGYPLPQCQVRICDDKDAVLAERVVGHIQIRGGNVTAGYYNDKAATQRLYTTDGWLRTGDLGLMQAEELVVTGRAKNIIIINGQNYYPHDIEHYAQKLPEIKSGQVIACGNRHPLLDTQELILFVVNRRPVEVFFATVARLRQMVMDAMGLVVDRVIAVKSIPRTTSGKIQHFKLIEQYNKGTFNKQLMELAGLEKRTLSGEEGAPATIQKIFGDCLHMRCPDPDEDFFKLGLSSIQASLLSGGLRRYGFDVSIRDVFEHPTLHQLATHVGAMQEKEEHPIARSRSQGPYPLSPGQQRFWLLQQMDKGAVGANLCSMSDIRGDIRPDIFIKAVNAVVYRHESLRTVFEMDGGEVRQRVLEWEECGFEVEWEDWRTGGGILPGVTWEPGWEGRPDAVDERVSEEARMMAQQPFDLQKGPLLRVKLFRLREKEYVFLFAIHHIICDGWSVDIISREIRQLYEAFSQQGANPLLPPGIGYRDYVYWQQQEWSGPKGMADRAYWMQQLSGELPVLDLPGCKPRPAIQTLSGQQAYYFFDEVLTSQLHRLSKAHSVTLFTTLMAILSSLLYTCTGLEDMLIGTDTAGRTHPDLEDQVGYYLNLLALRIRIHPDDKWTEVLMRVRELLLDAYSHQSYPFDRILEDIGMRREAGRAPLLDLLVIFQNFETSPGLGGMDIQAQEIDTGTSLNDMLWEFKESAGRLQLKVRYNTDLYDQVDVDRLAGYFKRLAGAVAADPGSAVGEYNLLTEGERDRLLGYNGLPVVYPPGYKTVLDGWEAAVRQRGDGTAVIAGEQSWSYNALDQAANRVAHYLQEQWQAGADEVIGLMTIRNGSMIAGMLGILKAGSAYLLLDADHPADRIDYMIKDSGVKGVLADSVCMDSLTGMGIAAVLLEDVFASGDVLVSVSGMPLRDRVAASDLAYVMYTSGSTGRPKGVLIEHRSLLDYVQTFIRHFSVGVEDVVIQQAAVGFDTMVEEIYPVLCSGGLLVMAGAGGRDVEALAELIGRCGVTLLSTTPLVLQALNALDVPDDGGVGWADHLRVIISGGDVLQAAYIDNLIKGRTLYNTYGPTETTVCATYHRITGLSTAGTLGRPVANRQVYIVNAHMQLQLPGIAGEICIGGAGLARGYLHREELTRDRFVENPFGGGRLYRTGDRGRWNEAGELIFLGRTDEQVKIRGYRIEPGEVEAILLGCEGITGVAVKGILREGVACLAAWYTGVGQGRASLRSYMSRLVPEYMIPSFFVWMDRLPVTVNGKLDYKALPDPGDGGESRYIAPGNDMERQLVRLLQGVLGVERIGMGDDFFAMGGHSLSGVQAIARIYKELGVKLELRDLFLHPVISELSGRISATLRQAYVPIGRVEEQSSYALSPGQRSLWILEQLRPGNVAFNLSWTCRFRGGGNELPLIEQVFNSLVRRHESLRTVFEMDGGEVRQRVLEWEECGFEVEWEDWRTGGGILPGVTWEPGWEGRPDAVDERVSEEARMMAQQPFDLQKGPLLRVKLFRLREKEYVFLFAIHHIICDGWSVDIISREIRQLYEAFSRQGANPLLPPGIGYRDYVYWQQQEWSGPKGMADRAYWMQQLSGELPVLDLPGCKPRPAIQTLSGQQAYYFFDEVLTSQLHRLSKAHSVTLFTTLMAILSSLLYTCTGLEDMLIGTDTAGRTHPDLEDQVGYYLNLLALRIRIHPDDKWTEVLMRVRELLLDAYSHQSYPFDRILEDIGMRREAGRAPLLDLLVIFQNFETSPGLGGMDIQAQEIDTGTSLNDMLWEFKESAGRLQLKVRYNTDLYDQVDVDRLAGYFKRLAGAVAADPGSAVGEYNLLTEGERDRLLGYNGLPVVYPPGYKTVLDGWEAAVRQRGDGTAVIAGEQSWSYNALDQAANRVAHYLQEQWQAGADEVIGLMTIRNGSMIAGMLGILKAGGAYLLLDADHPADRIDYMIKDSGVKGVLADSVCMDSLTGMGIAAVLLEDVFASGDVLVSVSGMPLRDRVAASDLAYVMYTSGSTGRPKGVLIEHRSLLDYVQTFIRHFSVGVEDVVIQQAAVGFDTMVEEIYPVLCSGGLLVMAGAGGRDVEALAELIGRCGVTLLSTTPLVLQALNALDVPDDGGVGWADHLRVIISGGDVLQAAYIDNLIKGRTLYNTYGPTETTVCATYHRITGLSTAGTLGRPVANRQVYIVNAHMQLQLPGIAGEICIGGAGLARGYLHREELTRDRFVENPFGGGRLYRTGDRGRWNEAGELIFLGRTDEQVKIRGYRIEPGEVEAILLGCEGITRVAVKGILREGVTYLAAWYTGVGQGRASLRSYMSRLVPEYMIPSFFVWMDRLPVTVNGKLDYKALPDPGDGGESRYIAPGNDMERQLVRLLQGVLGVERIGMGDDFFAMGGHSLSGVQAIARIYKELGVKLELRDLFLHPVISELSGRISATLRQAYVPIGRVEEQSSYALSPGQRSIWMLDQLKGDGILAYNIPLSYILKGMVDIELLTKAFRSLMERHETLRTVFQLRQGEPGQRIVSGEDLSWTIDFADYSNNHDGEVSLAITREIARRFDLEKGPLFRVRLWQTGVDTYVFLLVVHHIIADEWSMQVLMRELVSLYNRDGIDPLPELAIQYKDYAAWQLQEMQEATFSEHREYWMQKFAGDIPVLELPEDRPRPPRSSYSGSRVKISLPGNVYDNMKTVCRRHNASLFMGLLAVVKTLLYRYSGQTGLVVGIPAACREHPDLDGQVGFFVNTLPIRSEIDPDAGFDVLLEQVKQTTLEAYSHQAYPFDLLVEELAIPNDRSRSPLFDVVMVLQNVEQLRMDPFVLKGIEIRENEWEIPMSKYDISLLWAEREDGIDVTLEYNTDIFDAGRIERMSGHLSNILLKVTTDEKQPVGDIDLLTAAERDELLHVFNRGRSVYQRDKTLYALFETQVNTTPDALAYVDERIQMSYGELNEQAGRLAAYLQDRYRIGEGQLVGLMTERDAWYLVGMLGIIKCGAAYLPIDTSYPRERVQFMLQDAGVEVLIAEQEEDYPGCTTVNIMQEWKDGKFRVEREDVKAGSEESCVRDRLAYVIYTSGSTGRPKGVMIGQSSVIDLCIWHQAAFALTRESRGSMYASIGFDASVWETWPYLLSGGCLYPVPKDRQLEMDRLWDWLQLNSISHTFLPAAICRYLVNTQEAYGRELYILTGGDELGSINTKGFNIVNNYGPTESTVVSSSIKLLPGRHYQQAPIGRPIDNRQIYIVDGRGNVQPVGVTGEICIAGEGLAWGYLNRDALTEEKFISNPFGEGRLYRTGDLGRWLPDGEVAFKGRVDEQVKIRGYRVELGEIAQVLNAYAGISEAVVTDMLKDGEKYLVAYYTAPEEIAAGELSLHLRKKLPEYMIPRYLLRIGQLPLNKSGKLDKRALPVPDHEEDGLALITADPVELALAAIWHVVLRVRGFGRDDSFFELGGHSLKALELIGRLQKSYGIKMSIRDVFDYPTIASQAARLNQLVRSSYQPIQAIRVQESYPLSSAQQRLWVIDQLEGKTLNTYTIPLVIRLHGGLDEVQLGKAFSRIAERHESLRTVFAWEGDIPRQRVLHYGEMPLIIMREELPERLAMERVREWAGRPFELRQGPLYRVGLIKTGEGEWLFFLCFHHIIFDEWSMKVLMQELVLLYNNNGIDPLPALAIQYRDYAAWQLRESEEDGLSLHQAYWLDKLSGELPVLDLPTDRPRPAVMGYEGALVHHRLSGTWGKTVQQLTGGRSASSFMVVLTLVRVLLYRYTGQEDLVIGTPVAGREHPDLDIQIGFYVNTLALRTRIDGDAGFTSALAGVQSDLLEAYAHQGYPFDRLVERLQVGRDMSRSPLFDVLVVMQQEEEDRPGLTGVAAEEVVFDIPVSKFDMSFFFRHKGDELWVSVEYNTAIYNRSRIERMLGHLDILLQAVLLQPERPLHTLNYLTDREEEEIINRFNDTDVDHFGESTLVEMFEERVMQNKDSVALIYAGRSWSYGELNKLANQLAHYLRAEKGLRPGQPVGLLLDRSEWLPVAIWGILKAGGLYVPMDMQYPDARMDYIIADAGVELILSGGYWEKTGQYPVVNPVRVSMPDDLCYMIYTSGSTGKPKGVEICHKSVVNVLYSVASEISLVASDRLLAVTTAAFDMSVIELMLPVVRGAAVLLAGSNEPAALMDLLASGATVMQATPSLWEMLIESGWEGSPQLKVITGGEALSLRLAGALMERTYGLWNMYGPTETTVYATYHRMMPGDTEVLIGRPVSNLRAYILDANRQLVASGLAGTLYMGGIGLAKGYHDKVLLTAERFVESPWGRLYNTGDRCVWAGQGRIRYLGRRDDQVKLRGYRVELGEVEQVLLGYPGISQVVVVVREQHLRAYYMSDQALDGSSLRSHMQGHLPAYMVPVYYIWLAAMPLNSNGKIDKSSLPVPEGLGSKVYVAPKTELEWQLSRIWQEVLGIEQVGMEDNFFELGGHSLRAIQVISRIYRDLSVRLELKDLFLHPTLSELHEEIEILEWARNAPPGDLNGAHREQILL